MQNLKNSRYMMAVTSKEAMAEAISVGNVINENIVAMRRAIMMTLTSDRHMNFVFHPPLKSNFSKNNTIDQRIRSSRFSKSFHLSLRGSPRGKRIAAQIRIVEKIPKRIQSQSIIDSHIRFVVCVTSIFI
jgi:hypothetical protein